MKIVGFETNNGVRLGVVEGDTVIDVQAVDASLPGDLGEYLRRSNGDLTALSDIAKKAPASARIPPRCGWRSCWEASRSSCC